jgi:undecaprenyl diphosphate synthase
MNNNETAKPNMPAHIAFIMDGNGRWAQKRLLPRKAGHRAGVTAVKKIIDAAYDIGVRYLTFFAFSTENWKRPKEEIDSLFDIFREFLKGNKTNYKDKGIRLIVLGDVARFPLDLQNAISDIAEDTRDCRRLTVSIAFNYGSRDEILRAARLIKESGEEITEENFKKYLYTKDIPDPDMVVRTSGELRLSNFLLYQVAYSELYFTEKYWPDFDKKELLKAIDAYAQRVRRFGAV